MLCMLLRSPRVCPLSTVGGTRAGSLAVVSQARFNRLEMFLVVLALNSILALSLRLLFLLRLPPIRSLAVEVRTPSLVPQAARRLGSRVKGFVPIPQVAVGGWALGSRVFFMFDFLSSEIE